MAKRLLRFFLDNNVPDGVGRVLAEAGHFVIFQRQVLAVDARDPEVAAASAENDAILLSFDSDHRRLASRMNVSQRKLRRLSRVQFRCRETEAAERTRSGLGLIEAEAALAADRRDGRIFIDIGSSYFRTNR